MVDRQFSIEKRSTGAVAPVPPTPAPKWVAPEEEDYQETKQILKLDENSSTKEKVIICLAEICGTAILVSMGCLSTVEEFNHGGIVSVAFGFGISIMIAAQTFGHISGAHINPMVTVASAVLGNTPLLLIPIYVTGQILGSLAGVGLLKVVVPTNSSICTVAADPEHRLTEVEMMVIEFLLSLLLTWICCGIWDVRNKKNTDSISIKLGLAVTGLAFAGGPFTGAHMNPARTFGPSLIYGSWNNHWVYWVGPLSAGLLGALVYRAVFSKSEQDDNSSQVNFPTDKT